MLHLLLGVAGTGKTTRLYERLTAAARGARDGTGRGAVLLVPEQYSFEAERQVLRALGPRLALEVDVLSFTRLCNAVFRQAGGLGGTAVTPTARILIMSLAVAELQTHLKVYRKSCNNISFLQTLLAACGEFKAAGLTPAALSGVTQTLETGALRDKLEDLTALYAAYQAILERGYTDPDDDILRATDILSREKLFAGKRIFVDGFATFMAGEFALLGRLIAQAGEIHFAFTADRLDEEEADLFSAAKTAMRRLRAMAAESGVPVASPTVLREPLRYENAALARVATGFLQEREEAAHAAASAVTLCFPADIYRETEAVAAEITRLVREQGLRYRDIAVVARETGPYALALAHVFVAAEIPYFLDDARDVETSPLAGGLLAALEALRSGLDGPAVLAYAKSPLAGLDGEAVAALENYCALWGVRGKLWEGPLQNNPRGMAGSLTGDDEALLACLNSTKDAAVGPLLRLRRALPDCDGRGFAKAVYAFLEENDAPARLAAFAAAPPQGERETFLAESNRLWESLMGILDVFGDVLAATKLPAARFCELLRLALASSAPELPPQTLDEVLVGKADRIRPGALRAVFVVGAVEGEFPADVSGGGVFTDDERRVMISLGAEIGAPGQARALLERTFCYNALTLASRCLWVSAPAARLDGTLCPPSLIVTALQELFAGLVPAQPDENAAVAGVSAAFDTLARGYRDDTPRTAALLRYFSLSHAPLLARMERAAVKRPREIRDPVLARALFGERMALSPTKVERYHKCAFAYFAADGLRLRPLRRVEFNPLDSGSAVHYVLQAMVQRHGSALFELPPRRMRTEIAALIEEYLTARVARRDALPRRFITLFARLTDTLARLLRHLGEELSQSRYRPAFFELPVARDGEIQPLELQTADGVRVRVEGVVDRVDIMERGGRRYVRVVDYKSGGKQFRLDDVLYGLNLQMLLYLFTIAEQGRGALADAIPAGVLYLPVHAGYVNADRNADGEALAAARRKQWKMSGLLLNDEESLRGMEPALAGVFIPARVNAKGEPDPRSALAGRAEMGRLARKVKALITDMAAGLAGGKIAACPVNGGAASAGPCEYCDYGALCGFEPGDEVKTIERMSGKDVLELLRREEEDAAGISR